MTHDQRQKVLRQAANGGRKPPGPSQADIEWAHRWRPRIIRAAWIVGGLAVANRLSRRRSVGLVRKQHPGGRRRLVVCSADPRREAGTEAKGRPRGDCGLPQ